MSQLNQEILASHMITFNPGFHAQVHAAILLRMIMRETMLKSIVLLPKQRQDFAWQDLLDFCEQSPY